MASKFTKSVTDIAINGLSIHPATSQGTSPVLEQVFSEGQCFRESRVFPSVDGARRYYFYYVKTGNYNWQARVSEFMQL
jgi:hypothetical protein